jgi:hypothetical protein
MADSNGERKPIPGTRLIEYDKFYAHLDLPKRADGKNIPLFKTIMDREITPEEWEAVAQAYLKGAEAPELAGFISSKGVPFSNRIEVRKEANGEFVVGYPIRNKGIDLPSSLCPKTGLPMTKHTSTNEEGKTTVYFRAPGFPKLTLWGEHHGRPMSAADWRKVLSASLQGEAGPQFFGFKKADGSTYSMKLIVVEKDGKYSIDRFRDEPKYERTTTGVKCPICGEEIMDSGKYFYSNAYPRLLFPKELRGKKFSAEDFTENLEAWSKGEKGPKYWFTSRDGNSHYEAWLQMDEKKHYVNLEYVEKFDRTKTQKGAVEIPQLGKSVGLEEGDEAVQEEDNVPETGAKVRM